ncbi:S-adenosyl-L-methionine-dependent methyltransferase [Rhizophagus irregularis]|uniref:S-adenosyl-L-methionine-dependent methyltransferase n=1 Tax=Rhizophagus irregularis TaxID=588596 RepID=A0A2N1NQS2_9GLOM|nr:S-adenosyl-L-methionine-dependent methyltransferase [Rhizophagus irregularis]
MKYPLPATAEEKKMWLEDPHYLIRHLWQNNFSSPVEEILKRGANVLDIGCGAGTWSLEMAKHYPESNFIGVDIAPIFPTNHHEKNLKFSLGNIIEGLPFEDNTFDLVFARLVGDSFSQKEWEETVLRELLRLTKSGSWLEIMQNDSELSRCGKNLEKMNQALLAINMNNSICEKFEDWLLGDNQVSSINHEIAISPIGTWAGKTGEFGVSYIRHLSSKMKQQIMSHLNITEEEYDNMMEMAELEYNQFTTFRTSHRFIAQKK